MACDKCPKNGKPCSCDYCRKCGSHNTVLLRNLATKCKDCGEAWL